MYTITLIFSIRFKNKKNQREYYLHFEQMQAADRQRSQEQMLYDVGTTCWPAKKKNKNNALFYHLIKSDQNRKQILRK